MYKISNPHTSIISHSSNKAMRLTHRIQDNICIVELFGELILGQAYQLIPQIVALLSNTELTALVVNMQGITKFDSAGIASIITFYKEANNRQVQFAICQLGESTDISFRAVLLDEVPIYNNEQEALAAFSQENI